MNKIRVALLGNPNSGKTTLFNELTGSSAKVGNWPGVTVDKKVGVYKKGMYEAEIIDLPGVYSLSPYTLEEQIARDYIVHEKPDVILNIIDASNIERNLYLTTQILECDLPVVGALNMMDVVRKNKDYIDIQGLSKAVGIPLVEISALRSENIDRLMDQVFAKHATRKPIYLYQDSKLETDFNILLKSIMQLQYEQPVFVASKLLENDEKLLEDDKLKQLVDGLTLHDVDSEAEIADLRYSFIEKNYVPFIQKNRELHDYSTSDKIDRLLTHKILGFPIFIFFMYTIFHVTFADNFLGLGIPSPGVYLQSLTEVLTTWIGSSIHSILQFLNVSDWLVSLVMDGIVAGVGGVLSFIPQILLIFLFLSILEDTGYMARVAFLMDRLLRNFGLSGRAFLPLLTGFGCSVPAIMGARTLEGERERTMTMMLVPYMSCGAKAPIWALFASAIFKEHGDIMTLGIYMLGIFVAVISAILLKQFVFKESYTAFVMEMPVYHIPRARNLALRLWDKLKSYIYKAGTIILVSTIVLWFLSNFNFSLQMVEQNSNASMLGQLANAIRFFFIPLGFASGSDGWKAVVAILAGFIAKEAVVSTMGVLYTGMESGDDFMGKDEASNSLMSSVASSFTPLAAISFMAFNLLSVPCMAAVAALRSELNNRKKFMLILLFWVCVAWIVSFLIYNVGGLLGF